MEKVVVKNPKCFIISAPSGAGKTVLMNKLVGDSCNVFYNSVSDTTRKKRSGEFDGIDYNFISIEEFKLRINNGEYLEWAEVHGNYYGTKRAPLFEAMKNGLSPLLVIDVQGYLNIKKSIPEDKLCSIFILPPSEYELIRRIKGRGIIDEGDLKIRLINSRKECAIASDFKYCITNDDFDVAYSVLKFIIGREMGIGEI